MSNKMMDKNSELFNLTDRFPLGFWNYTDAGTLNAEQSVNDWQTLGMNLAMSSTLPIGGDKQSIIDCLNEAQKRGIKVIICDERTVWHTYTTFGENEYRKGVLAAVKDFGSHPAFYAFNVGDEPHIDEWADMENSLKIVNSVSNGFVNFLPLYDENGPEWHGIKYDGYADLIVKTALNTGLKMICYDCYMQCEFHYDEKGIDEYFKNLAFFKNVALRAGAAFWTTLLSVGHWKYRVPTVDDLRWQIYTAAAHGVNGILWFFIYEREKNSSYRGAPVNCFYEKTPMFYDLSAENRTFLKYYANNFIGAKLKNVYHLKKVYAKQKEYKSQSVTGLKLNRAYGSALIISEFAGRNGDFVAVTNNEQREIEQVFGEYNGNAFDEWLAPGQMIILK